MMSRVVTWCGGVGSGGGGSGGGEVRGGDEMVTVERQPWRCLMVTTPQVSPCNTSSLRYPLRKGILHRHLPNLKVIKTQFYGYKNPKASMSATGENVSS
ncbi:hypothetical protein Tco_0337441 [Tanacetum coccineum]